MRFIAAVSPETTALAVATFDEDHCLTTATDIIDRLRADFNTVSGILHGERDEKYQLELAMARETARADSAVRMQAELMAENERLREGLKSAVQSAKDSALNFRHCDVRRCEMQALLRELVQYEERNAGWFPVIMDMAERARKLLGMEAV